jgi:hypothetical protein
VGRVEPNGIYRLVLTSINKTKKFSISRKSTVQSVNKTMKTKQEGKTAHSIYYISDFQTGRFRRGGEEKESCFCR